MDAEERGSSSKLSEIDPFYLALNWHSKRHMVYFKMNGHTVLFKDLSTGNQRNMANLENLSKPELKNLLIHQLRSLGVDTAILSIKIGKGPSVTIRGEVYSESERYMVLQTIMDETGIDDIKDDIAIMEDFHNDLDEEGIEKRDGLYDEDSDFIGTEDIFRSIEDGIPYIPPTNPSYQELPEIIKWKKKKNR